MTVLGLLTNVADKAPCTRPTTVVNSTEEETRRLLALMHDTLKELKQDWDWPQITKEASISLVSTQEDYALPVDFERWLMESQWDDTNNWPLIGPLSPQEWQAKKRGITTTTPRRMFRVRGYGDKRIFIHPVPAAADAGALLYYEYVSSTALLPKTWATATVFAANSYCSYNANIYLTSAGGTTGATPPTHTSSSASDGAVTWTYQAIAYPTALADTDFCILSERLVELGVIWRFLRQNGLEYGDQKQEYYDAIKKELTGYRGARAASMVSDWGMRTIGPWSVPDTGIGS